MNNYMYFGITLVITFIIIGIYYYLDTKNNNKPDNKINYIKYVKYFIICYIIIFFAIWISKTYIIKLITTKKTGAEGGSNIDLSKNVESELTSTENDIDPGIPTF